MADQVKSAAEQEGQSRLMAFAMGVGRLARDRGTTYEELAKRANVREDMLTPVLVHMLRDLAAEQAEAK